MMVSNFTKEQDSFSSIRNVCEKKGKLSDPIHQEVKSFFWIVYWKQQKMKQKQKWFKLSTSGLYRFQHSHQLFRSVANFLCRTSELAASKNENITLE